MEEGQEANYSAKVLLPARTPVSKKKGGKGKGKTNTLKAANLSKAVLTRKHTGMQRIIKNE